MQIGELYKLEAADGLVYYLADGENRYVVNTLDNAGLPPTEYLTRRPYRAHRLIETGFRLNPRSFAISYQFVQDCNRDEYWQARAELLNAVRPNRGDALTVTLILSDGTKYAIKARALTPVFPSVPVDTVDEFNFAEVLQFDAFDPVFFAPDAIISTVDNAAADELAFPISFIPDEHIYFGAGSSFGVINITNTGTWFSYPRITITPPYNSVRIHHNELNVDLEIIRASSTRQLIIDLDIPSITDDLGNSLFNYLTPDSDLQGFKIEVDPVVSGGINTLVFSIPGAVNPSTTVQVEYLRRFIGI